MGKQPSFLWSLWAAQNQQTGKEKQGEHRDFSLLCSREVSGTTVVVSFWELNRQLFPHTSHKNCQGGTSKETGYGPFPAFFLHTVTPRLDRQQKSFLEEALKTDNTSETVSPHPESKLRQHRIVKTLERAMLKRDSPAVKTRSIPP